MIYPKPYSIYLRGTISPPVSSRDLGVAMVGKPRCCREEVQVFGVRGLLLRHGFWDLVQIPHLSVLGLGFRV